MQTEKTIPDRDSSRKTIIVVAIVAALVIGGLFYLLMRKSVAPSAPPRLAAALRPGSAEFEKYKSQIVLDELEADEATSVMGGLEMTLKTTVRNLTGRTISGLELKGVVVDHQNQPVKERVVVVLPNAKLTQLDPNKTMPALVRLQGFADTDDRANIRIEVAGVSFSP